MTTTGILQFRLKRIRGRLLRVKDPYQIHRLLRQAFRYAARACDLNRDDPRVSARMTLVLNDLLAIVVTRRSRPQ